MPLDNQPPRMSVNDMRGELVRQRLREREIAAQQKREDAAIKKQEDDAEMQMLAKDAQDLKFGLMKNAGVSPVPSDPRNKPIELPASGILPGEEQVTTADTFRQLSPMSQKAIKDQHAKSGVTTDFDSWLSDNYATLPPDERVRAMRQAGTEGSVAARKQYMLARDIINRNARLSEPSQRMNAQEQELLLQKSMQGSPLDDMRQLQQRELGRQEASRWARVADNNRNRALTAAMNNPRVAEGLFVSSLNNAQTPMDMAKAQYSAGNVRAARDLLDLVARQHEADRGAEAVRAQVEAQNPEPKRYDPIEFQNAVQKALSIPDAAQQKAAVELALKYAGYPDGDQTTKMADNIIKSAAAGTLPPPQGWGDWLSGMWNTVKPYLPQWEPPQPPKE